MGCAVPPTTDAQPDAAALAESLDTALQRRRIGDFLASFPRDEAGIRTGLRWYSILAPAGGSVAAPSGAPSGGTLLKVTWTLPGDRRTATDTLFIALATASGRTVVSSVREAEGSPIWTLGPSRLTSTGVGTLVSSGLSADERSAWAARMERAAADVRDANVLPRATAWSGGLVVQIPAGTAAFQTITGVSGGEAAAVADCRTGTPRIVVNPIVLGAVADELSATLTHEAVHVATDSPCLHNDKPYTWAVEGLAESVAAQAHPEAAKSNLAAVRDYLRERGVPDELPERVVDLTEYALAQVAADQVRAHLGRDAAADFFDRAIRRPAAVTDAELADARDWYRAELRRIARSG